MASIDRRPAFGATFVTFGALLWLAWLTGRRETATRQTFPRAAVAS